MGFSQLFPPAPLLNFNHKNSWPREDIEARGLKFCMLPRFIKTHAGKKYENDLRKKKFVVGGVGWVVCLIIVSALGPGLSKAKC